jgi:hypothetical protein
MKDWEKYSAWQRTLDELLRQQRITRDALGPEYEYKNAILRQHKQRSDASAATIGALGDAYRLQDEMRRSLAQLSLTAIQRYLDSDPGYFKKTFPPDSVVLTMDDYWRVIRERNESQRLSAVTAEIVTLAQHIASRNYPTWAELQAESLASSVVNSLLETDTESASDDTDLVHLADRVALQLAPQATTQQRSGLIRDYIFPLMLAIMTLLVNQALGEKSTKQAVQEIVSAIDAGPKLPLRQTTRIVNVRKEPSTGGVIIDRLPAGTVVIEVDRSTNGWRFVRPLDGQEGGWVYERYLRPADQSSRGRQ